ncbi:PEPxxWA-CTERM sorting domain-containing protein [Sandaracinobacteroides saxicola]|uniref:PEP-CTERM sorting domain-containing protein n=1 Tax=Sandaracinobacteroides saxicola TaxID=2759707 RepID=A0A7G5IF09_9SPHN|nr:PEPxxWA-CTERM sorting domain-containing protein [Sandaracinobacteroides saxicola]QMW21951.1 PEP-CTERM sorting domain-containing protein [Sandaracinobacteroides saxicola]
MRKFMLSALVAAAAFAAPASAVTVLTFEGLGNLAPVGNFYAPNYIFSPATLAIVDADAGGSGNFANEPSPNTIMFFLDANNAILNAPNGFTTGFSFFYSSSTAASVNVYDGLNATGNLLASLNLTAQGFDNCSGDPGGAFCNWTAVGVAFSGTALSIDFGGTANQTGFDNITFGSDKPVVPEPATWAMMIVGFGLVGAALRRRAKGAPHHRTAVAA